MHVKTSKREMEKVKAGGRFWKAKNTLQCNISLKIVIVCKVLFVMLRQCHDNDFQKQCKLLFHLFESLHYITYSWRFLSQRNKIFSISQSCKTLINALLNIFWYHEGNQNVGFKSIFIFCLRFDFFLGCNFVCRD